MIKTYDNPTRKEWAELSKRPEVDLLALYDTVSSIFKEVKEDGDQAVEKYTLAFDKVALEEIQVDKATRNNVEQEISPELKTALDTAYSNIYKFHHAQIEESKKIETSEGVVCWRENRPIEKVGFYIPGGTAPLFSTVLMLGIPAQIAGCKEVLLCTPPDKNGAVHPAILYAAQLVGVSSVFKVGGIQAIASLTFGTETIPQVHKIFGPGNQYVMAAKQVAQNHKVAIDMPAGPSEVLVVADESCVPAFVAADLLSQAEHGVDSQVVLVSDSVKIVQAVLKEVDKQLNDLPRKKIAKKALERSKAIVFDALEDGVEFSNFYAPEHLILAVNEPRKMTENITNAGSVFLGNYSCESAGDYASGTNHTLPTNAYAKAYSGVSVDSFVKKITVQELSAKGIQNIGPSIERMAETEGLTAHKNAVSIRLNHLAKPN